MGKRREGREAALQFLFSNELNQLGTEAERSAFWELRRAKPLVRAFAEELVEGTNKHLDEIDTLIDAATPDYDLDRIAKVDHNILRIAIFELIHLTEVPQPVVINEAIEMGKRFSGEESGKFINAVLDSIRKKLSVAGH